MNQSFDFEKKKGHGKIIIMVVVVLLLVGVGYTVYTEFFKDKEVKQEEKKYNEKEEEEEKERELSKEEEEVLLLQIKKINSGFASKYPLTNINAITKQERINFIYTKEIVNTLVSKEVFSSAALKKGYEKYFGNNEEFIFEDLLCPVENEVLYAYSEEENNYTLNKNHPGHGGPSGAYDTENFIVNSKVVDDKYYTVGVNVVYAEYCGEICPPTTNYYKNTDDSYTGLNLVFVKENPLDIFTEDNYLAVKDKLDITEYTFEKDSSGNYSLKSVVIK